MEKFSVYADKTTGISPFMPVFLTPTIATYLFHTIIIPIKILTFIPVLTVYPILSYFPNTLRVLLDVILAYFFNVSDVALGVDGVRKSDEKGNLEKSPKMNDVVLVNATGPLDWLVWKMVAENPRNVKVGIATNDGIAVVESWKAWTDWCLQGSMQVPKEAKEKIVNITDIDASSSDVDGVADLKKHVGENTTFYVVVEGTITNGKGVLSCPKGFDVSAFAKMALAANYGLKIMSTRVSPSGIADTVIPTSLWYWLFFNFGSLSMNLKYRLKLSVVKDKNLSKPEVAPYMITDTFIREKLANNGRMKVLGMDMGIQTKREYMHAVRKSLEKKRL